MATLSGVTGMDGLERMFTAAVERHGRQLQAGLTRAGLQLLAWSQDLVPVWTGNLRASGYTRIRPGTKGLTTVIEVGYTANYAIYVHEDLELRHGREFNEWWRELIDLIETGSWRQHDLPLFWHLWVEPMDDDPAHYFFDRGERQQAKFLEGPFRQRLRELKDIIREEFHP